ncbi:MAG: NADP-dependent malic enzyme [Deltaproteobacteria bacterium]|jgi:malate dehydrogenase (oxaloacetate-decarboxylating)|nr:NADP-dependent malic enzyme [Deltaproteobacteria bacterium]
MAKRPGKPSSGADALAAEAVRLHAYYRGKVQIAPRCPVRDLHDFSLWYTPGVAASCRAIVDEPERVWEQTNRGNAIAIVSDGSRVLGLGDIGPEAGLPVMEGKSLLFKVLGGVDATPLCVRVREEEELIRTLEILEPSFGAVNLEDIASPRCFRVLDASRERLQIPVWHDDQQGTATVLLAGLTNALEVVGKRLESVRIAMVGVGAANVAVYRLLTACGLDPAAVVACDTRGTLHPGRSDLERRKAELRDKWRICCDSNADGVVGGIAEALRGADVCIALSAPGPGVIQPQWVGEMAPDAIVFACANPVPEIWPEEARAAGARVVATGRCDFPNQVNNSLAFPGIFRGTLDVRARKISDGMAIAAARELAAFARERGLREDALLPTMEEWQVYPRIAAATAMAAQDEGLTDRTRSRESLLDEATAKIQTARRQAEALVSAGVITLPPRG